jgi:hypothetical protein
MKWLSNVTPGEWCILFMLTLIMGWQCGVYLWPAPIPVYGPPNGLVVKVIQAPQ